MSELYEGVRLTAFIWAIAFTVPFIAAMGAYLGVILASRLWGPLQVNLNPITVNVRTSPAPEHIERSEEITA